MSPQFAARRAMALTLAYDAAMAWVSMWIAVELRGVVEPGGAAPFPPHTAVLAATLFAVSAAVAMYALQVHRQVWRHVGWPDAMRVVQAVGLAALIFLPAMFLWNRLLGFPRSSLLIALGLWLALLFAGRMIALWRSTQRPFQIFSTFRQDAPRAILVGTEQDLANGLRDLHRQKDGASVRALALIDLRSAEPGRAIRGVTVMGGLSDLGHVIDVLTVRYGEAPWVAVVGKRRPQTMASILEALSQRKVKIMALGKGEDGPSLTKVRSADLLSRPERNLDLSPVQNLIEGARVLVTGAGGTIGSELARQCAALNPASLTLFDSSEYNLYAVDMDLREQTPNVQRRCFIGNVRDPARVRDVLAVAKPDVVLHAAALKHVPLMEENPAETVLTNVGGAITVAEASIQAGVKRFVFISTDKAVDPGNVMGATKRLAEMALTRCCKASSMALAIVRFGNVLGSSGSVVPLFERQIDKKGPVTVTHQDVTRYFMTVEEASALVLQAAALKDRQGTCSLYVLDMGDPVRITALAEAMIRLKGYVPYRDIPIKFTGMRPGEKLHETLHYGDETKVPTSIDGIIRVEGGNNGNDDFKRGLEKLLSSAQTHNDVAVRRALSALVPDYAPSLPPTPEPVRLRR